MIKPGQNIEVTVMPTNIKHYRELGYKPIIRKKLIVKAEDIPLASKQIILYICDYCGKEFSRTIGSNTRSKTRDNNKDACKRCAKDARVKETCKNRYNTENPMQVEEIMNKCFNSKRKNFINEQHPTCTYFEKGIPVSIAQKKIADLLPNYELNYKFHGYYIDLFDKENKIAIEYNGGGHTLEIEFGNITLEEFEKKEEKRTNQILSEKIRLLIIEDSKDYWRKENIDIEQIENFIKSDQFYKKIIIS